MKVQESIRGTLANFIGKYLPREDTKIAFLTRLVGDVNDGDRQQREQIRTSTLIQRYRPYETREGLGFIAEDCVGLRNTISQRLSTIYDTSVAMLSTIASIAPFMAEGLRTVS
jgi:hypothetical protein